ncbi:MAG TPA: tRNA pseudouridine(55) synthase TruB [Synergistetes bacterium]|nr:tRNA pseudouridine(55) synthase TruB [Synergistota bacterium]
MRSGFLVVDKNVGARSTSCVGVIRNILGKNTRVGHGGTLDSTACGVLVILVGKATRTSQFVMNLPKLYRVIVRLGVKTTTDDMSGEIISRTDYVNVQEGSIDKVICSMTGLREQVPPAVSAVRVQGSRAHSIARKGIVPDLSPRIVMISSIRRIGPISREAEFPMEIRCHKGTYIRSIVRDIGTMIGCGAAVSFLQREEIGPFNKVNAIPFENIPASGRNFLLDNLLSVSSIGEWFTTYRVKDGNPAMVLSGRPVPLSLLERISWGKFEARGMVVIEGPEFVTFGTISLSGGVPAVLPSTTIEIGEID